MPMSTAAHPAQRRRMLSPLLPLPAYAMGALLQNQSAHRILQAALSDAEYQTAVELPEELRTSLYPELLTYGPAYEDIQKFYSRMAATNTLEEANFTKEGVRKLGWPVVGNGAAEVVAWSRAEKIDLSERFADLALQCAADRKIVNWDREFTRGFVYICWLLTGQYLFPSQLVAETQPDWVLVNNALERLGLPPLTGRLSNKGT